MDYNTMIDRIGETRKRWSNSNKTGPTYEELLLKGNGYWQNLNRLTQTQLEIDIIDKFLNSPKWLCHLALPKDGPKRIPMLQNLMACLQNTPKYYSALNAYKLENVNFADLIAIDGHQIPIIFAIDDLYTMFLKVGNTFSRVAASKLMNLALPDLFMMWDNNILDDIYNTPRQTPFNSSLEKKRIRSYISFLILMQENINHIKKTCPPGIEENWSRLLANINQVSGYRNFPLPLPRLLDIANYSLDEITKCKVCLNGANTTISNLQSIPFLNSRLSSMKIGVFQ